MIAAHFTYEQALSYFFADSEPGFPSSNTGGVRLAEKLYNKFGLHRIQSGISEREVAVMSQKRKVTDAASYKGLTFRGDGYGPLVLQEPEFQASGVMLATGDVYTALQTGVIDSCEIGNAFGNYALGIQEITKYWTFPGMQQLCQVSGQFVTLDLWKTVPVDLQSIIELCVTRNMIRSWAFSHVESARIIPVLQNKWGIEICRLTPECQLLWKTVSWRLVEAYALKNAEFKEMWDSHKAHMQMLSDYEILQTVTYPAQK